MQVAYITRKVFADGSQEIRIKHNYEITPTVKENIRRSKQLNKTKREIRIYNLEKKLHEIKLTDPQRERKTRIIKYELQLRNIANVNRSAHRSRQSLYDICKCNDFQYFVTFTYDPEKIERKNDKIVKRKFTQWANDIRKRFPNMFYVAVPEYHKKGGLHFHLLIGGVTFDELKCEAALTKRGKLKFKNGKQIFNVTAWKWGFSTLSIVENSEASKHYICKYISKQHLDGRFFNKRRYYVSHNIRRPEVTKTVAAIDCCMDGIDVNVYTVAYADMEKRYAVLTTDGNGVVDTERNTAEVKQHMQELCASPRSADGCARLARRTAARNGDGACPYLTLRTLDRNNFGKDKWKYIRNKYERAFFRTLRNFRPPHEDYNYSKWEEQTILDEYYANMAVKPCENEKSDIELCREIGLID